MFKKLLLSTCLLLPLLAPCQQKDTTQTDPFIEDMSDLLTLKFTQSSDIEKLAVYTPVNDIKLAPNLKSTTYIGLSYRFITGGYSFAPAFIPGNNQDADKGKTKRKKFGLNFNFGHWQQELSYTRTRGYYLENTKDYLPNWQPYQSYIQFPDLFLTQYQGMTAYSFNRHFSLPSITTHAQRQLKSAGSFIPLASYTYAITDDRSPIRPGSHTQKTNSLELLLGPGYFYNFVLNKKWYVALGALPQAGAVFTKLSSRAATETAITHQTNMILRIDGRLGIGYNDKRFFSGIYTRLLSSHLKQEHTSVTNDDTRFFANISIGYRFNAPQILARQVQFIDDKRKEAMQRIKKPKRN